MFLQKHFFRFWLPEVPCPGILSRPFSTDEDDFVNIKFHIVMILGITLKLILIKKI